MTVLVKVGFLAPVSAGVTPNYVLVQVVPQAHSS